jgi:dTDP-4-amino-4,6-dideoxygalactose transaminase
MTDIQAALGFEPMANLEPGSASAVNWPAAISGSSARTPPPLLQCERRSAFHLLCTRGPEQRAAGWRSCTQGIGANVHYMPIYRQTLGFSAGPDTAAPDRTFYAGAITVPLFPHEPRRNKTHLGARLA